MKKIKQLLENRLLMLAIIFVIVSIIAVIAGDIIVQEGNFNISHDLIADTDTLYVDSTNDKVGIGIATPSDKLTVNGALRLIPQDSMPCNVDHEGAIYYDTDDMVYICKNGAWDEFRGLKGDTGAQGPEGAIKGRPHMEIYDPSLLDTTYVNIASSLGSGGSLSIHDATVEDSTLITIASHLGPGGSLEIHDVTVADSALVTIASHLGPGGSLEIHDVTVEATSLVTIASYLGPDGSLSAHDVTIDESSLATIASNLKNG